MKQKKYLVAAMIFFSLYGSTSAQQSGLEEAKIAIAKSNDIYFQAFAKGDSSIFIGRYAKDCWIMAPNEQALCGDGAPLDFFRTAYHQIGLRNGKFITIDVFGDGKEYVTEIGFWQSFDANNKLFDNGKYLVLWKKTPEGWKMFRDSFSSDRNKQ
ncbi:nuclear transport factor 2 family protein [Flavitalea sp. BT771]|uniref:YybH family protein n=1 Tax=Flavitalea sp. BT771 TaxID=3063329 RepID=UPI0026E3FCDC|nr:nuclear transport factor 2 family protein [Flavitalea sp. BT771]MDO6429101.1 nuclear transport factor 2 family protein [Flavitalea sp. BT771]MDV6218771.1 nuclear transport factor 2 family protein [Flavitalea sp. BT771]